MLDLKLIDILNKLYLKSNLHVQQHKSTIYFSLIFKIDCRSALIERIEFLNKYISMRLTVRRSAPVELRFGTTLASSCKVEDEPIKFRYSITRRSKEI